MKHPPVTVPRALLPKYQARIMRRCTPGPDGCVLWQGGVARNGYGKLRVGARYTTPHRVMYQAVVGRIRKDRVIDHTCRVKLCVAPAHLEAVTNQVNVQRGWDRRRADQLVAA